MPRLYCADMHVHTKFSCDGENTMAEMTDAAISQGLKYICFTDHFDMNPHDYGYTLYDYAAYFEEIERLRDLYSAQITILKGIEFSEPHLYRAEFNACLCRNYDYVLASIHWLGDNLVISRKYAATMPPEQLAEMYYHEVQKAVALGGFDALAHMDYVKRGLGADVYDKILIVEIMNLLAQNNIALEVNTQHLRFGDSTYFPDLKKIWLYRQAGGNKILFGSDAHNTGDIGKGVGEAVQAVNDITDLCAGVYINRQFVSL